MLRKVILSVLISCIAISLSAQQYSFLKPDPEYKSYKWDDSAKLHTLSADEMKLNEVIIKDKRIIEYYFVAQDTLAMFTTHHFIARVNSDKAIEENNTVYISLANDVKVIDIKARAIDKDGRVTMLNTKNIKDVDNYQNLGPFRIFAIDGVEKGGEVEYLYTVRHQVNVFGTEYINRSALHKDIEVDLYSPSHLVFISKSYNGFPDMVVDTLATTKRHLAAQGHNIEGYEPNEEFSAGDGALLRMEYTIAYNKASNDPDKRLYDYNDFCQWLYATLDKSTDKQDVKVATKIIDTMKLKNLSDEDKIKYIESRVKTSVQVREDAGGEDAMSLQNIFKNRVCDAIGIMKVYKLLFDAAGIKHEIVMTSDRYNKPFDGDFDSRTYLQNYLIYFPTTNNYIAPTEIASRYGFVPSDWICEKGFFMHSITVGKDVQTGVGKVRELPCNDYKTSMGEIYANVKFDFDMGVANLHFKQTFSGYEAYSIQPFYTYLSEQDKKDYLNKVFQSYFPDAKPTNAKASGYSESDLYKNPFVVEADISTNSVLEKAGNKYLFKAGELIGPQSQLYNDTTRHTPIENHYNHGYHREISFEMPEGYKVTNLNAANMDVYDSTSSAKKTMEFHSYYKVDGNKVIIYCDEYYSALRYPISMYQQFRTVINASADFNKLVLFLEKK
ncbi:MAG TPA: DUF3857 domain-containing protein [Bacteroidia bacterium]|jgi:hypothetical protein|nr:DUF3857 domain-containing protein [Bacteroidia bacterium]